jgi:hypothetical protein
MTHRLVSVPAMLSRLWRAALPLAAALSACGQPDAGTQQLGASQGSHVGTWQFDFRLRVLDASGNEQLKDDRSLLTLEVGTGESPLVLPVGSCRYGLRLVEDVASLPFPADSCVLTGSDQLPMAPMASGIHPEEGTLFAPLEARFELVHGDKPQSDFYAFEPGEDGLRVSLEYRLRHPASPGGEGDWWRFHPTSLGHRVR